jgi:catechol 2,3-dioxygenase-like lactoylglutathione lyase family enzyme
MTSAKVRAITAVVLVTPDAERLAGFYETGLGFRRLAARRVDGADFEGRVGATGGATALRLGLGDQRLELLQFDDPGQPYPEGVGGEDLRFQHFALVVSDMAGAFAWLQARAGWTAISRGQPVRLPPSSGGVTAFKFRDPDGHPAELLAFDAGQAPPAWRGRHDLFLGIDHSAISVADAAQATAFYQGLGLRLSGRSHNRGPEQARLDGLADADTDILALSPPAATPHVELLAYRTPPPRKPAPVGAHDVAATRLVFAGDTPGALIDPDGHRLIIIA